MRRAFLTMALAAGLAFVATAQPSAAQVPFQPQANPYVRPAVSPYLNLARSGNPAINLYGLVKPQIDTNRQIQSLQTQQQQQGLMPQLGVGGDEDSTIANYASTGHPAGFFNYSHYYGPAGGFGRPATPPLAPTLRRY
jgi:hypothetical protein